jgi:hypothetical protein
VLNIFGRAKAFSAPWIGNRPLNLLGLHPARIAISDVCLWLRRPRPPAALARDGIAVIRNALPEATFRAMRNELRAAFAAAPSIPVNAARGFGAKRPFPGGFDRFDGGTLNRYLHITDARLPVTMTAVRDPGLAAHCRAASGFRHHPERFLAYETIHGDDVANPDPQRVLHRDTFHSTIKLWLFLDDVTATDGPFMYAPGSHRMSAARYRWEYARACAATRPDGSRDGSFRASVRDLAALGVAPLRAFPVAANTLILADVRGFHRRGDAAPSARRVALYANLRLWPFSPVRY